jgi:hypothetical protein
MAKGNVWIRSTGGLNAVPVMKYQTEANAAAINAGELCKIKTAGSPYVIALVDGDLTVGTDSQFVGLAASDATHTASADGSVLVYMASPSIVYEAKAKTAASVDTQTEIDALVGDRKIIDVTSTVHTVDEAAADSVANALTIVGGNPVTKTLYFTVKPFANAVDGA